MLEIALSGSQAVKSQYNCLDTDRSGLYRQYQGGTDRQGGSEEGRQRLLQDQDQIKVCPARDTTFPPDNFQPTFVLPTFHLPP